MNSRFSAWERQLPSYNIEEVERSEFQLGGLPASPKLRFVLFVGLLLAILALYRKG